MSKLIVTFLCSCIISFVNSQNLTVEGTAPNLYVTHTVAPKENFYSVGRLYNQAPKVIAAYNNITLEKGLTIGQQIKIPLSGQNLKTDAANTGENSAPLTHIVAKGETLFRISHDNNVTPQLLKSWNNLATDNITPGTPLIVGYLKMQSPTGAFVPNTIIATTNVTPQKAAIKTLKQEPVTQQKEASQTPEKDEPFTSVTPVEKAKAIEPPATQQPIESKHDTLVSISTDVPVVKSKNIETPKAPEQKGTAETAEAVDLNEEKTKALSGDEPKAKDDFQPSTSSSPVSPLPEGAFADIYLQNSGSKSVSNRSGEAATFKSTSGWQDKKYYVLINDIQPGAILKITASNNKYIYAKVLGNMPEMKENNGLLLRISNSAASYLGIIDPKFSVQVSYYP